MVALAPTLTAAKYSPLSGLALPPGGGGAPPVSNPFLPAPPPAPTGSDPGSITFGGSAATPPSIPDYNALLALDPGLMAAEADLKASGIANTAQRNAAFQTDAIDWGKLPDLGNAAQTLGISQGDLAGIFGPDVSKLADENTAAGTSQLARLNDANTKQIQSIQNVLNARGIYNSGETGYQLGQQQQHYTQSQYDGLRGVLAAMSGAQQSYLSAEQQREMALAQAASDAANRIQGLYPPSPGSSGSPATTASYAGVDTGGNAVYQGADGTYYNYDGSPYSGTGGWAPDPQTPQYVATHTTHHGF